MEKLYQEKVVLQAEPLLLPDNKAWRSQELDLSSKFASSSAMYSAYSESAFQHKK